MAEIYAPIRLLVADDHVFVCEMLQMLFEKLDRFQLVGEVENCRDVVQCAALQQPDVIVLDLILADGNSLVCLPKIKEVAPRTKIVVFSGIEDETVKRRAVTAGALGWVQKKHSIDTLVRAIKCVHAGEAWLERKFIAQVLSELTRHTNAGALESRTNSTFSAAPTAVGNVVTNFSAKDAAKIATLTKREHEIIGLVSEGCKNKQIASRLFVSEKTVHSHLASIYQKLNVANRLELAVFAHRTGLGTFPK